MNSVMTASFAKCMGLKWPKHVASIVNGRVVTWDEVRKHRLEQQHKHLKSVLACPYATHRRACYVWTLFVPGMIFGGWHTYLCTLEDSHWFRYYDRGVEDEIMAAFPLGILPIGERYRCEWREAFARSYPRPGKKKQGVAYGWIDVRGGRFVEGSFERSGHG